MILKNYQSFKESKSTNYTYESIDSQSESIGSLSEPAGFDSKTLWIHEGDFKVTSNMVGNGSLIKDKIPNQVKGNFSCSNNQLISLEGCPATVGGDFYCHNNKLTSLEGCPSTVGGDFYCGNNQLTSLVGSQGEPLAPSTVGGGFICYNNKLTSLEGCPSTVGGDFQCDNNKLNLTIEQDFIKSGSCSSQDNFFIDLLKYLIKNKIALDKITTWPEGFLSPEIIDSAKGIAKFNL